MKQVVKDYIGGIRAGEMQVHKNLAIVPLFMNGNGGPSYITLREALEGGAFTVTEVSLGGSVPELKVINKGDIPVLLLDGEELSGAKQNRVLNTTVLIAAMSETNIPVSCTEQGRWSYTSSEFGDSDVILSYNLKREKARSVTRNVRESGSFRSDQGQVWDNIAAMAADAHVDSRTGAMRDIYVSKETEIDEYLDAIRLMPSQKGMAVIINGILMGFDILSSDAAYAKLHKKLLKSCAIEALAEGKARECSPDLMEGFLKEITTCKETAHPSVGLGTDHRFEGKEKVGSALVHEEKVIHMAFFAVTESEKIGRMAGISRRRRNRTR